MPAVEYKLLHVRGWVGCIKWCIKQHKLVRNQFHGGSLQLWATWDRHNARRKDKNDVMGSHINGMFYLQYLGHDLRGRRNWHVRCNKHPYLRHKAAYHPLLHALTNIPQYYAQRMEFISTILTEYQPFGEDSKGKSPSFSNILSRYSTWTYCL